ncbi:hypothetical protein ACQPW3_25620 [Actinosynnema sp. CA-248983]
MTSATYIAPKYQTHQTGTARLYSGDLQITKKDGTIEEVAGEFELLFTPRMRLMANLAIDDQTFLDIHFSDYELEVRPPDGACLEPPSESIELSAAEDAYQLSVNHLTVGDATKIAVCQIHVIGPLLDEASLPNVETESGTQGQLHFSLLDWNLQLAKVGGAMQRMTSHLLCWQLPRQGRRMPRHLKASEDGFWRSAT